MLFWGEFFKTQSNQNIHQNTPNCTMFSKFFLGELAYAPEPPKHICVQL